MLRLYLALRQQGLSVGFKRLRRLLRSNGIFHRYHRKYIATTDSNHNLARLPNLIDRQFNRYAINQAWCGDITYIPTDEDWLFMASVLDLASRYSFDSTMKTSLVVDALRMAIANEHPAPGLIFHSDQGSQYCSHVFQEFLLRQGISGSMSERGQCWDNAPAESFWATLKRETLPLSGCFSSRKEAQDTVTRWISHYNGTRPHSQLGMRSPYQFRLRGRPCNSGFFIEIRNSAPTSQFQWKAEGIGSYELDMCGSCVVRNGFFTDDRQKIEVRRKEKDG